MNLEVGKIASWLAIVSAIGIAAVTVFQYENRLRALEGKAAILLATPAGAGSPLTPSESPRDGTDNPMVRACAEIAMKTAAAIEQGTPLSTGGYLKDLMKELGCT